MHWLAKVSVLHNEYKLDVKWANLSCEKRMRGRSLNVSAMQSKCIPNVLWLRTAAAERGARVCKRHAASRWFLQTSTITRKVLFPIWTRSIGSESDWNAWFYTRRNKHVQGQGRLIFPNGTRLILIRQYDHEILLRLGSWRTLVCHSTSKKYWLRRLVAQRRQFQTKNGIQA